MNEEWVAMSIAYCWQNPNDKIEGEKERNNTWNLPLSWVVERPSCFISHDKIFLFAFYFIANVQCTYTYNGRDFKNAAQWSDVQCTVYKNPLDIILLNDGNGTTEQTQHRIQKPTSCFIRLCESLLSFDKLKLHKVFIVRCQRQINVKVNVNFLFMIKFVQKKRILFIDQVSFIQFTLKCWHHCSFILTLDCLFFQFIEKSFI